MNDPQPQVIEDRVSDDTSGAREIGFSIPSRYNASAILFDNIQRGNGGRIALRGPAGDVTYDALCRLAGRAGNALLSLGLRRGERVLLLLDDTPLYPAFFFGAIRAGLVPVLLNTLSPPDLLQFYLADAGARAIVIEADIVGQLTPEAVRDTKLEAAIIANGEAALPHVGHVLPSSWIETFPDTLARRRYKPRRHGLLDVFVRLDRPAQGRRASATRHALHRGELCQAHPQPAA